LSAALDDLAESQTGEITDPTIVEFTLARLINTLSGGTVVAPWQVKQVPERYLIVAQGMNNLKERRQRLQQDRAYINQVFSSWRRQHPSYRKLM